jgi:hypothetical protein
MRRFSRLPQQEVVLLCGTREVEAMSSRIGRHLAVVPPSLPTTMTTTAPRMRYALPGLKFAVVQLSPRSGLGRRMSERRFRAGYLCASRRNLSLWEEGSAMAAIRGTLRRAPGWVAVLVVGLIGGMMLVQPGSAAPPDDKPEPDTPVAEQNLDSNGYIAVHEQGTANVNVTGGNMTVGGTIAATQSGTWTVGVNNFPSIQPVSGTVSVGNLPTTQNVNVTNSSIPVAGTVEIGNSSTNPVHVQEVTASAAGYGAAAIDSRPGYSTTLTVPSGTVLTDFVASITDIDSHGGHNCDIVIYDSSDFLYLDRPSGPGVVVELHLESGIPSDGSLRVSVQNTHGNDCAGRLFWTGHS